jgi:hypothetical protein
MMVVMTRDTGMTMVLTRDAGMTVVLLATLTAREEPVLRTRVEALMMTDGMVPPVIKIRIELKAALNRGDDRRVPNRHRGRGSVKLRVGDYGSSNDRHGPNVRAEIPVVATTTLIYPQDRRTS